MNNKRIYGPVSMESDSDSETNRDEPEDHHKEKEQAETKEEGEIGADDMDENEDKKELAYDANCARKHALDLQYGFKCESKSFVANSNPMGPLHKPNTFFTWRKLLETLSKGDFLKHKAGNILRLLGDVEKWISQDTQLAIEMSAKGDCWRFKVATYGNHCWHNSFTQSDYWLKFLTRGKEVEPWTEWAEWRLEHAVIALRYVTETERQCSLDRAGPKQAYLGKVWLQDCYFAALLAIAEALGALLEPAFHPKATKELSLVERGQGMIIQLRPLK